VVGHGTAWPFKSWDIDRLTIMFSQTLGTALGDWTADTAGLGYIGGAIVFGAMLAVISVAYYRTNISHTVLFWAAFILTRPLGAVVGDFLDKPITKGVLELSRYSASAVLLVLILSCILIFSIKPAKKGIEHRNLRSINTHYVCSRSLKEPFSVSIGFVVADHWKSPSDRFTT
jgi:hypothetical protein